MELPEYAPGREIRFSALQRAENSSIPVAPGRCCSRRSEFQCSSASRKFLNRKRIRPAQRTRWFQCSSASRKFLNHLRLRTRIDLNERFSALQRAENSSIRRASDGSLTRPNGFSALQRAENSSIRSTSAASPSTPRRFSALQRAENSSIGESSADAARGNEVSVLFSEPKIPQ